MLSTVEAQQRHCVSGKMPLHSTRSLGCLFPSNPWPVAGSVYGRGREILAHKRSALLCCVYHKDKNELERKEERERKMPKERRIPRSFLACREREGRKSIISSAWCVGVLLLCSRKSRWILGKTSPQRPSRAHGMEKFTLKLFFKVSVSNLCAFPPGSSEASHVGNSQLLFLITTHKYQCCFFYVTRNTTAQSKVLNNSTLLLLIACLLLFGCCESAAAAANRTKKTLRKERASKSKRNY